MLLEGSRLSSEERARSTSDGAALNSSPLALVARRQGLLCHCLPVSFSVKVKHQA